MPIVHYFHPGLDGLTCVQYEKVFVCIVNGINPNAKLFIPLCFFNHLTPLFMGKLLSLPFWNFDLNYTLFIINICREKAFCVGLHKMQFGSIVRKRILKKVKELGFWLDTGLQE